CVTCCFFFSSRRRHTSFSRDWSSDVCSSDLVDVALDRHRIRLEACLGVCGYVLVAGKEGDDPGDPGLFHEPRDLLVAAHATVLEAVASDPLGDCQTIGDDPHEIAGLQARDHLRHIRLNDTHAVKSACGPPPTPPGRPGGRSP